MPVVEIDEAEFRRLSGLNNFASKILANPEAAALLEKAAKTVDPTVKTPRLDQQAAASAPLTEMQKKIDDLQKTITDNAAEAAKNRTLETLQSQRDRGISALRSQGYLDSGIEAVQKLMEEKGILDPLDAAAIYEKNHPPQVVNTPGTGGWNFMDQVTDESDADIKKLIETKGELDPHVDQMARKALNDIRQASGARR